jgi:ubiquinone/menaquinone biosynthesis C-methylase UbiE
MEQDVKVSPAYKAAEAYETFFVASIYRYWTPLLLQRAAPQKGERVLDVACGTGVVARSMVPMVGPQGKVVGLDINPAMLEVACQQFSDHCAEIDWREGRAENMPFSRQEFDLVTCQQGIQFFNRTTAAREMYRVLRPKGRVAISVWRSLEENPFYKKVFGTVASVFNFSMADVGAPFVYGDQDALKNLLLDAGFQQVRVDPVRQEVYFHDLDHFVEMTTRAASVVIPAFSTMDGEKKSELMAKVNQQLAGYLKEHTKDGVLTFTMAANIATGIV